MAANCPPAPKCKKGAPGWMVTFGDMMALLLTFFVLLLSMSQFERVKFEKAVGSLKDTFGTQRVEQINAWPSGNTMVAIEFQQQIVLVRLIEKIELHLSGLIDNGQAEITETDEGFLLRINSDAMFSPGTPLTLHPDVEPQLQQVANLLEPMPNLIRVAGHTSSQPPPEGSPFLDNWSLSSAYASAVVNFLSTEGGIEARRLQVRGMGQYSPRAGNDSEAGRILNQRLEILISRETLPVVTPSLEELPRIVEPSKMPSAYNTHEVKPDELKP